MDWKSNFNEEQIELIERIRERKQQSGCDFGSLQWIVAVMADVLDNAEEIINEEPFGILNPARPTPDLSQPIEYKGPPRGT